MSDPATGAAVAFDGMTVGGVSILGALFFILLWAFRESLTIMFAWIRKRLFGPPDTAVGSSSGSDRTSEPQTDTIANRPMIEDHFFFVTIEELLARRVPTLKCGCAVRSEMLRDMMTEYLCVWRDFFAEFMNAEINREGFEAHGAKYAGQFANRVATLLIDLQDEITDRWMRIGVPAPAILAFRRWDAKLIETLTSHSEKIAQSAFFPTNRARLIALLTQHTTFLALLLLEARTVLRKMNGTLDGQSYKRGIIAPVDGHDDDAPPGTDSDPPPDIIGGLSKPRPKAPSSSGVALTRKQRSGEWRDPSASSKKPSGETRARSDDARKSDRQRPAVPPDEESNG